MLNMQNINVTFGRGTKLERRIFDNLNLYVAPGEFVTIIGGNGAGKSTLFNVISGYIMPDRGSVMIDQEDVTNVSQIDRAALIAKVMQDPRIGTIENMSIEENMSFAYMRDKKRGLALYDSLERRKLFQQKLKMLGMGLENKLDELVCNLSGGQRQALSIIMAIIADFKILLLDEITAALDPKTAEAVMTLAAKIAREEKRTTIMITHNMQHAITYSDRILVLSNGKIAKEFNGGVTLGVLAESTT